MLVIAGKTRDNGQKGQPGRVKVDIGKSFLAKEDNTALEVIQEGCGIFLHPWNFWGLV